MNLSKVQHEENTELEVTYDLQISQSDPKKTRAPPLPREYISDKSCLPKKPSASSKNSNASPSSKTRMQVVKTRMQV